MSRNHKFVASALTIFIILGLSACAGKRVARDPKRFIREHSLDRLPRFDIPVEMNDRVVAWMEYFQGPGRNHFERYLERSGKYIPLMQEILKKEGMPKDLVYIALIESGFNTRARSYASAVGPWQFIQGTGKRYNLRIDGWVDERRDPFKSTQAAAAYFKDLYSEFGDWYLAMAGYNAGEGRVRGAIELTGSHNFWEMADDKRAFRAETRDYVPKYIAAAIMAKMPERFGFDGVDYQDPLDFDTGIVETQTDVSVLAKCAETSEDDISDLNPHLVRGATPPDARNYEIRLPKGKSKIFAEKYALLPESERIQIVRHEVRKGETLAKIAKRYGVRASAIAAANNLRASTHRLVRGSTLVIPTGSMAARYASIDDNENKNGDSSGSKKSIRHTVKKGESLGKIANRYGVKASEIMAWNNIKNAKRVHAGMRLVVKKSTGKKVSEESEEKETAVSVVTREHKVQRGDTLVMIARRYGTTPSELLAMNGIENPKQLRAGMKLVVSRAKTGKAVRDDAQDSPVRIADARDETRQPMSVEKLAKAPEVLQSRENPSQSLSDNMSAEILKTSVAAKPSGLLQASGAPVKLSEISPKEPAASSGKTDTAKPAALKDAKSYQVKNGDTLWDIARRHKVSIAEIQKWNNLKDPSAVRPGSEIKIYKK